jgi:tetratricopeptide (TPR) repeat protein
LGSVFEPYLGGTPDVAALLSRWVELGFSYGEAAIAAQQSLSWQTTVVGDPLYRPFARKPKELHEDLERRKEPWLEWSHLRVVNLNLATGLREPQLTPYLEEIALTKTSAVLMEKLGDLYAAGGKPASAKRAYEQALALNPSPQQRARLNRLLAPATTAP